ncbi:NmrA-like family protein [Cadophora sp. MPI-SDFR-AT-0126]|nr:NmrA-like family protein [Leotiomycetes sp. MPI-SDFR-AT-0126]
MTPSILIVGATGNTGRSVVSTLSEFTQNPNHHLASYRLVAQTRSAITHAARLLASLPNVSILEQNWPDITGDWLRENNVTKVFIAAHTGPTAFSEESHFLVVALNAGVKQAVRISTTGVNVRPDFRAYYPRTHWAIETMLDTPEFKAMMWTSLQPNGFTSMALANAVTLVKEYRKTGKQHPLSLMSSKDVGSALIDPNDVGIFAAYVLADKNPEMHNGKRYVLNGPEDISGQGIVDLVESEIGIPVENVVYKDLSWLEHIAQGPQKVLTLSIKYAVESAWAGKCKTDTTSKEVFGIYTPKTTPAHAFKEYLKQ